MSNYYFEMLERVIELQNEHALLEYSEQPDFSALNDIELEIDDIEDQLAFLQEE